MNDSRQSRYSRQVVLPEIGSRGQKRLAAAKVLVAGCGALGSAQAELLVRAGVGHVVLVDRDVVEWSNLQRQQLFDEEDAEQGRPKAIAAAARLARINSSVRVEPMVADITPASLPGMLEGVDVVMDGLDNFESRYLLNDACVQSGIPWFYGAVQGTAALAMPVVPGAGPCLRCVFPDPPPPGSVPTCDMSGVLGSAVAVVAAMQVSAAMRWLISGVADPDAFPILLQRFDLWSGAFSSMKPGRMEECPCCGQCLFPFLEAESVARTRVLCGRTAIQVQPAAETSLDLNALQNRIAHFADTALKDGVLEITEEPFRLLAFRDGRCIVHGTVDATVARRLVAKFIG